MIAHRLLIGGLAISLALVPLPARAQTGLDLQVKTVVSCDQATFEATVQGGAGPYTLNWQFGDSEQHPEQGVAAFPDIQEHIYPAPGEYSWSLTAIDSGGLDGAASAIVVIDGPTVTLESEPFPPILTLESGEATASFTAQVTGGQTPYIYTWDLNGDGDLDPGGDPGQASFTYVAAGKYLAKVQAKDNCGLVGVGTLPVVVIDPEAVACHPMAQRIADAVNTLFPRRAETLYICEDIFAIFRGALTGSQVGFGRLWHAYQLSLSIEGLTWEEIRDWHLVGNGWGLLVQLDRFAETLDQIGVQELVDLVLNGEASIGEIRSAVRAVVRYDADFNDALTRLGHGMSPGELGRFYRTAQDLELEPSALDDYLAAGITLQELSHAARLSERTGTEWSDVAQAHASGHSWGEIGQAQRLADGQGDWLAILEAGVGEVRSQQREQVRSERQTSQEVVIAERLASQYGLDVVDVLELYHGGCAEDWGCVRQELRQQSQSQSHEDGDDRTAERLAAQYGVTVSEVSELYDGSCAGNWNCVRAALRDPSDLRGGPKPKD